MEGINPSHLPYLEKYRIFELFHELARELVIQQPKDHVEFLKNILMNAKIATETSRVIILSSPKINCHKVAISIVNSTKQILISPNNFPGSIEKFPPDIKVEQIQNYIRQPSIHKYGWILVNCLQTRQDAELLIKRGILPTHVLYLIAPNEPPLNELLYCKVPKYWPNYRRNITEIRDVLKKNLREIYLSDRRLEDVVDECVRVIGSKQAICPIKPRILIIGPRGSGRKTQAKLLVEKLQTIHIDFGEVICKLRKSYTEIGRKLCRCSLNDLDAETAIQIINKEILDEECIDHGWVLTGFPRTETDLKYFDSLDTPPNRVIFLECDLAICQERLQNEPDYELLDNQLRLYCENYGNMRKYCGNSANYVDSTNQHVRHIHENIMAIIGNSSNPTAPRTGFNSENI